MNSDELVELVQISKDPYAHHREKLVEVHTRTGMRYIGFYAGLSTRARDIVLLPNLAWTMNDAGQPELKMNPKRPRDVNLESVEAIGPIDEKYVSFYLTENLKNFLDGKVRSDKQPKEQ